MKSHIYVFGIVGAVIVGVAIFLVGGLDSLFGLDTQGGVNSVFEFGPRWFGLSMLLFLVTPLLVGYWTARTGFRRGSARGLWHGVAEGATAAALSALLSGVIGAGVAVFQVLEGDEDLVEIINGFAIFLILVVFSGITYFLLGLIGGLVGAAFSDLRGPDGDSLSD